MDAILDNAHAAGRDFGRTVPAGPNRADHVLQIAWAYARANFFGRSVDIRAVAEAFINGAA